MNVLTLDNDKLARLALLVMYAWDMCDADIASASTSVDPRIAAAGLTVLGFIAASDDIITSGPGGLRQNRVAASSHPDQKRYGYVAHDASGTQWYVVIRGTDGAEEWFDDFVFVAERRPGYPGRVETGFHDIYASMHLAMPNDPAGALPLAAGLAKLMPAGSSVLVLGHSLGAAIATYLAYDLAAPAPAGVGAQRAAALLFASPKTGDHEFVDAFSNRFENYLVLNYEHDLVPKVPPFDITCFDLYRSLPQCKIITDEVARARVRCLDKACCHHLISYIALLSPSTYQDAIKSAHCTNDNIECAKCVESLVA
ncbi:MAG: lipase family protein [Leptothrix sp. (in: b-proteobacteria)]